METAPLASVVAASYPASGADRERLGKEAEDALDGLFGSRYHSRSRFEKRVAFMDPGKNVPFAGLVHHESPSSGVYGGMSLCWFPVPQDDEAAPSSLLTFV
jgi:hypothetical protein